MPAQPLAGLVVLDLSRVLAGPYATQMLGDLGAEVWKVERAGVGDETRAWGPPFVGDESAYFLSVNRNKLGVALDFTDAAHCEAIRRAAVRADIVVENFVPGDLARYGLDASLRRDHPELIVCSITGYGQDGPYASLPGYDAVMQGFTGLMSVTGDPEGPPTKVGVAVIDVLAGVHAAAAILAALVGRLRGGGGAHLDIALAEVALASFVNVAGGARDRAARPSPRQRTPDRALSIRGPGWPAVVAGERRPVGTTVPTSAHGSAPTRALRAIRIACSFARGVVSAIGALRGRKSRRNAGAIAVHTRTRGTRA